MLKSSEAWQSAPAWTCIKGCCDVPMLVQLLAVGCAAVPEPSTAFVVCQAAKEGLTWMSVQRSAAFWQATRGVLGFW